MESISIMQELQPGSVDTADTLGVLGSLLAESGDLARAVYYLDKALKIIGKAAPSSLVAASIYSNYGVVQQRLGLSSVAKKYLQKAMDISDALLRRASYSHAALQSFSSRNYSAYVNAAELHIALGEGKSALEVAERGRGRALRMQLAERDLLSLSDLPGNVAEKIVKLEKSLDEVEAKVAVRSGDPAAEHEYQSERLALFREREELIAEIRRTSLRLANLRYPQVLSADGIQSVLEPGTTLVCFLVSSGRSFLFTVSREDDIRVQVLQIGENELRRQVERFRSLIDGARPDTALGQWRRAELRRLSKELYELLIGPAADRIENAERVLIVADGPLHYLPFATLVREVPDVKGHSHDQYLAEWKPLHSVLSATVYAEIKKDRLGSAKVQRGKPLLFAAFGDPQFPPSIERGGTEQVADVRVRSAMRRGTLQLEPLPYSRREVEGVAALFPPEQVAIYLGAEATEERAKATGKGVRILHFATHARLDDRFPLDSALTLTMPQGFPENRDNGLLQVWEIFEKVRIDADLVVLSACDTGLGKEQGGEGLIGLTRAFHYAGARTVMASLWQVQDQATSELMIRFYKHLRAGLPKDQALQAAQQDLIREPIEVINEKGQREIRDFSPPYYWAGFQLYGDWQ